jgi:hypothetical protein
MMACVQVKLQKAMNAMVQAGGMCMRDRAHERLSAWSAERMLHGSRGVRPPPTPPFPRPAPLLPPSAASHFQELLLRAVATLRSCSLHNHASARFLRTRC